MSESWQHSAACKDDPGGGDYIEGGGPGATAILSAFIERHCTICPVAQECLDSSIVMYDGRPFDDGVYGVRGGYLPTAQKFGTAGRPSGPADQWTAKPPPYIIPPKCSGESILKRGVCHSGKHGILSEEDVISAGRHGGYVQCRQCKRDANRKTQAAAKAAKMAA